jgi:hypothetical protein
MKRDSRAAGESMHETGPYIGAWRRRLRFLLPRKWLEFDLRSGPALRARKPARARMELDADAPASSWVAWEVSRRGRPPQA